jgi:hypothetical protein
MRGLRRIRGAKQISFLALDRMLRPWRTGFTHLAREVVRSFDELRIFF